MTAIKTANNKDMNGQKIINVGTPTPGSNDVARQVEVEAAQAYARSRANHTGTQLAATISDFDTQVRTSRLDQLAAPTGPLSAGGQKIINAQDPASAQDVATMGWTQAQLAALASGQTLKGTVRAVSATNVNIASAPATIDGITPAGGDVFLLAGQSTGAQNGPYVWTAAGAAMTRATNWDTSGEAVVGSYWIVREGTQADKFALLTNDTFTLATTTAAFTYIGMATAVNAAVEQDCGNGALTSFTITHNFGTRSVKVMVRRNASPWDEIECYNECPDVNTTVIKPDVVWATNEFHVAVAKM